VAWEAIAVVLEPKHLLFWPMPCPFQVRFTNTASRHQARRYMACMDQVWGTLTA